MRAMVQVGDHDPERRQGERPFAARRSPTLDYVGPTIAETHEALDKIRAAAFSMHGMATLGGEINVALLAEEIAQTANQIREMAISVHRGIAKRAGMEPRI